MSDKPILLEPLASLLNVSGSNSLPPSSNCIIEVNYTTTSEVFCDVDCASCVADAPFLPVINKRLKRCMSDHEETAPQQKNANQGSLDSSAAQRSSKPAPSKAISLIILKDNKAYVRILRDILEQLPKTALKVKGQDNTLKILPTGADSFLLIRSYLTERNIFFHTFTLPDESELKVELEGVPYTTLTDGIHAEFLSLDFFPTSTSPLHAANC